MKKFRLFRKKVLSVRCSAGIDGRYLDNKYTPTECFFEAMNLKSAYKKAGRFWTDAQLGMGSFILKEVQ